MLSLALNTESKYNFYNMYGYEFECALDVMTSESEIHVIRSVNSGNLYISKVYDIYGICEKKIEQYMTEVKIMKILGESENIVKIVDCIRTNSIISFVLEMCNGDLYSDILKRKMNNQIYSEEEIMNIMGQILNGLNSIHNNEIIHGDLKSTNIFINNGQIKIGDFGISQIGSNNNLGTLNFLSYESIKCGSTNKLSDLFQVGCIMYELVTLSSPFCASCMNGMIRIFENENYTQNIINNIPSIYSDKIVSMISNLLSLNASERLSVYSKF